VVQIEIRNFQAIAHTVIEVDGFSVLAGKSNIGKSSVVRAIKAALTGAPADIYVRHSFNCPRNKGAKSCKCFCSVHIVTDGLDLLWEKGDTVNRYVYNDTTYTVVGKGTPEFLMQDFAPIKLGDEKEIIQVSDQFNPIFILDESGTIAADILSDVAKLDQINIATRLAEKDRKEASSTRKVREKDILDLRIALTRYEGLDAVVDHVSTIEDLDGQTEVIGFKVEQLERFIETVLIVVSRIKSLEKINLIELPDVEFLITDGSKFERLKEFIASLADRMASVSSLDGVDSVTLPSIDFFLSSSATYAKLVVWESKMDSLRGFFGRLRKFDSVSFPVITSLEKTGENYFQFSSWFSQMNEIALLIAKFKKDLEGAKQEEVSVLNEFKALGVCSGCNRPFVNAHQCLNV